MDEDDEMALGSNLRPASAGVCARAAYLNNNADPTPKTALSRVVGPNTTAPSSHSGYSVLAAISATRANGSTPSSRPATAPQAPNRESDNSSNPRRPSAIRSTAKKTTPPRKPG